MANATDPNWLAYQAALGLESAEVARRSATDVAGIQARRAFQIPVIQQEAEMGGRDIATARANAGMYQSSFTQQLLAEQARRAQNQMASIELDTATQIAGINTQSSVDVARLQREAAERALTLGLI